MNKITKLLQPPDSESQRKMAANLRASMHNFSFREDSNLEETDRVASYVLKPSQVDFKKMEKAYTDRLTSLTKRTMSKTKSDFMRVNHGASVTHIQPSTSIDSLP